MQEIIIRGSNSVKCYINIACDHKVWSAVGNLLLYVNFITAFLSSQMLTMKLSTMRFTMVGLDNRKLWIAGR